MSKITFEDIVRSKDEFAQMVASFVRDALDEVGTELPNAGVALRWRKYVVIISVDYDEGDIRDEPSNGHPSAVN